MRRSSAVSGPVQVSLVAMTATAASVGSASGTAQCRHQFDVITDARSSRPPPSRPSKLFQSTANPSSLPSNLPSSQTQLPPRGRLQTNLAAVWKRTVNGSESNGKSNAVHHSRLMGCVSGQRSPTSPEDGGSIADSINGRLSDLTSDDGDRRRSSGSSSSPLENGTSPIVRRPPPSSTMHSSSTPSSTMRRSTLSAAESAERRSSCSYQQPSNSSAVITVATSSVPRSGEERTATSVEPEPKRGRSRETMSKSDRKKRVVGDRSPAALWRSISSSSLVRSLSRRRSNKNIRNSIGHGPEAFNGDSAVTSDDCRSKMSSSVDTEDSDPDVLETDGGSRPGRSRTKPNAVGGAASSDGSSHLGERRQSDAAFVADGSKGGFRRRSFFSRSFRRSRSTPAEEFVNIAKTNGNQSDVVDKAETERLPRKRMSCRNVVVSSNDVSRSTLSSRAASWASLKRSLTSDSLSSVNNRGQHSTSGLDVAGVCVVAVLKLVDIMVGKWISAMAYNPDRRELIVVDFRAAYIIDVSATGSSGGGFRLIRRVVGPKGGTVERLVEPIGVSVAGGGSTGDVRLVFTDRADQSVKVYSGRGHYIRSVGQLGLSNVGGVAVDGGSGDVFVAGTDGRRVVACRRTVSVSGVIGGGRSVTSSSATAKHNRKNQNEQPASETMADMRDGPLPLPFQHPYSVTVNPANGDVIVGDDYAQEVVALSADGRSVRWRWVPPKLSDGHNADSADTVLATPTTPLQRPFFPSSICADTSGRVFVADLYNERVYMLDGGGGGEKDADDASSSSCAPPDCPRPLLTKKTGLRGGPLSLAVDESRLFLYVADEERTVRVFSYAAAVAASTSSSSRSRSRATSDSQEEGDGNELQRLRLHQHPLPHQPPQQQQSNGGSPLPTVDSSFSYCVADVAEEY